MKKTLCLACIILLFPFVSACKEEKVSLPVYSMGIELNDDMTLDCQMTYTFENSYHDGFSRLEFNLYPNAYRQGAEVSPVFEEDFGVAYPSGFSEGGIEILSVKNSGKDATFSVQGENEQILKVWLNGNLSVGEKTEVYVKFKVTLPKINHRLGFGEDSVNLSWFYPVACVYSDGEFYSNTYYPSGDPFYSECANYLVKLNVPSTYTVASSLPADKTEWSGGTTEYSFSGENVRDVAFFLSQKYNVLKERVGDTQVTYYYYSDQNPEDTLSVACSALEYFGNLYGEYPYEQYSICQGDFIYGGMEYSGLSLIADNVSNLSNYTVVHETAHQWFHGVVGFNESEIGFLDEGLAEFSTALFMGEKGVENKTYADYLTAAKKTYLALKSSIESLGGFQKPVMARNLKDFKSNAEYVMVAYNRSQITIDELMNFTGRKKFFKTMKSLVEKYKFKNLSLSDFVSAFEKKKKGAEKLLNGFISGDREITV